MSIFNEAHVTVFVADFANVDAGGKANAIGAGFEIIGTLPTGATGPMYVTVWVTIPSKYVGQEFSLALVLKDAETGNVVSLPGPMGNPEPMQVQQLARVNQPMVNGAYLPKSVPARVNLQMGFPTGLPLPVGKSYRWSVQIDGQDRPGWFAEFHVLGPPPGPIFGGFNNPAGVEDMPPLGPDDQTDGPGQS